MNQFFENVERLEVSTADCDLGPVINWSPGKCELKYDYDYGGSTKWVTITWDTVIAVKTTPDPCITQVQTLAYSKICEVKDSDWIRMLHLESTDGDGTIPGNVKHFLIYFDHNGAVEIIAKEYSIDKG